MSDEDSKFYLFKALGFNIGKSKFDTKGFSITNLPLPIDDNDAVNLNYIKKEYLPIKESIETLKKEIAVITNDYKKNNEMISQIKNDLIELTSDFSSKQKKHLDTYMTVEKYKESQINLINDLAKLSTVTTREIIYEINAKKQINGGFIARRMVEPGINRHGLSYINIYSSIELLSMGCRITFINKDNKEIHSPAYKNQKDLKEPLKITIKEKNNNQPGDIVNFISNSIVHHEKFNNKIKLDKKFLERIKIEPENIGICFETKQNKNIRDISDGVENIHITIVFVVQVTYNNSSSNHTTNHDD